MPAPLPHERKTYTWDDSRAPVYVVRFHGEQANSQITTYLRDMDALISAERPFASIVDSSEAALRWSNEQMSLVGDWINAHRDEMGRWCAGIAYVLPNVLQRMALRSLFFMARSPNPYQVVKNLPEALSWCREQLARAHSRQLI